MLIMTAEADKTKAIALIEPPKDKPSEEQGDMFPEAVLKDFLDIERQRIASLDKKTETARLFIEASDASDKRQYEFQMAKLTTEDQDKQRKHRLAQVIFIGGGTCLIFIAIALLGFMFFGDPAQREEAIAAFKIVFTALGGYGVVSGGLGAAKKLIN